MRCSSAWRFALVATLLALAPPALAQDPFDPLVLTFHGMLTKDGRITENAPEAGALVFVGTPTPGTAAPLRFVFDAPVTFAPGAPFDVAIRLRADAPVLARDADGDAFEINVDPGGTAVRLAIDPPLLTPGSVTTLHAQIASASTYEEGTKIALSVRPLMAFTDGSMAIVVGGDDPSTFLAPDMRVPAPSDLRLQDVGHTEFLLETESFEPPATHAVNIFRVGHTSIAPPAAGAWSQSGTYVVLRGEETGADAASHAQTDRARRIEAAHEYRVNGVTARVHPGLGVVVRVLSSPIRVECFRQCPAGFSWSYELPPTGTTAEPPSTLVVPPRDTSGIPVSEDEGEGEDEGKATPAPLLAAVAALVVAALVLRRR